MRALGLVQLQRLSKRVQHGVGDAGRVAAFELGVVGDADTGEGGDLLAPEPWNPPRAAAVGTQASLFRRDPRTPRGQELADLGSDVHSRTVALLAGC
jgi:hypothetical protein